MNREISSCIPSNDKNCTLVSCLDSTLRLLDKQSGELLVEYQGHKNTEYKLIPAFTNSDSHVISGSEDGKIYIWDLVEAKVESAIDAHFKPITCIDYHPKLNQMVSCSFDGSIKIWS